jgi:hypothetical protein
MNRHRGESSEVDSLDAGDVLLAWHATRGLTMDNITVKAAVVQGSAHSV